MSENKTKEKMSFLQWIDNFWYHNKAIVIIGFFAIVMVVFASMQFFSKKDPDVFVYYVGKTNIAVNSEEFRKEMAILFAQDVNGDGTTTVDFKKDEFVMVEDESGTGYVYDPSRQREITRAFNTELSVGDAVIYIMDPSFFNGNKQFLCNLEDVLGFTPENSVDGKGLVLSKLRAYNFTSLRMFPEDYIICVRMKKTQFDDEYFEGNVEFFKKLVDYMPT